VAKLGHLECARLLLEHGANPLGWLDSSGPPVEAAMRSGHDEIADLICLYGGACEIAGFMYSENILAVTAMLRANPSLAGEIVGQGARGFNEEVGEKILELCFAEGVDACDMGLWQLRGLRDKPKLLRTVLQHGADPNTARYGATVLHIMAEIGDVGAARVLLECGADIHARDEDYAATPLAWAVVYGKKDMVKFLLENGAEIELPDDEPWATPLFWAQRKGYAKIADLLQRHRGKK